MPFKWSYCASSKTGAEGSPAVSVAHSATGYLYQRIYVPICSSSGPSTRGEDREIATGGVLERDDFREDGGSGSGEGLELETSW